MTSALAQHNNTIIKTILVPHLNYKHYCTGKKNQYAYSKCSEQHVHKA